MKYAHGIAEEAAYAARPSMPFQY